MSVVPLAFKAVTVTVWETPAVVGEVKPFTRKLAGLARLTRMPDCVPVIVEVTASIAVIDCVPAVFRVALKLCTPLSAAVKV